jgi:hypothetical protein
MPDLVLHLMLKLLSFQDLLSLTATCARLRESALVEITKRIEKEKASVIALSTELENSASLWYGTFSIFDEYALQEAFGQFIRQIRVCRHVNMIRFCKFRRMGVYVTTIGKCMAKAFVDELLRPDVIIDRVTLDTLADNMIPASLIDWNNFVYDFLMVHHTHLGELIGGGLDYHPAYKQFYWPKLEAVHFNITTIHAMGGCKKN